MTRTNAAGVLTVLIRAVGLWLAAQAVMLLPYTLGFEEPVSMKYMIGPPLLLLAVALAMWVFADLIARLALVRGDQPPFESDLDASQWQAIAFATVGAFLASGGLVILVNQVVSHLVFGSIPGVEDSGDTFARGIVYGAVKLTIGAAMMLGASGLAGLLRRLRGHDRIALPASDAPAE